MKKKLEWRNQYTLELRKSLGRSAFRYWEIPRPELFGSNPEASLETDEHLRPTDIYSFTMWHYVNFLDTVACLDDLREGLFCISPFADDAFKVSTIMADVDFVNFKLALVQERRAAREECLSVMPQIYQALILPDRFLEAIILSEKAATSLGCALIRIMEVELGL